MPVFVWVPFHGNCLPIQHFTFSKSTTQPERQFPHFFPREHPADEAGGVGGRRLGRPAGMWKRVGFSAPLNSLPPRQRTHPRSRLTSCHWPDTGHGGRGSVRCAAVRGNARTPLRMLTATVARRHTSASGHGMTAERHECTVTVADIRHQ